jgi:hypothetical protein
MNRLIRISPMLAFMLIGACCSSNDMCIASSADTDDYVDSDSLPTDAGGECCAIHGNIDGSDNICAISETPKCVGCDGKPVLCMTTGCGVPFVDDCCLDDDGATVTCPR